jgi:alpha-tubulin suppressor-like RCC1 family protein
VRLPDFEGTGPNDETRPVRIRQVSAGVDMSMAVSTDGRVYAWGKTEGGRLGLGAVTQPVYLPRQVSVTNPDNDRPVKAIEVACGYVHSMIVGLDGTVFECGGVGVDGEADGQQARQDSHLTQRENLGHPRRIPDFNLWHRIPEPKDEVVKKERWKKFGKYEVRGRSKMMSGDGA